MVSLKSQCDHPTTGKLYIKSCVGGRNNSPEGHDVSPLSPVHLYHAALNSKANLGKSNNIKQHGLTHGFVVESDNEEDRKYYLKDDPAHMAFVKGVGEVVNSITVLDFVPGLF